MKDHFQLAGKIALVSGASSGLGAHFARVLAQHGARVVLAARRLERLERLVEEISQSGGRAIPVRMDVADPDSVKRAFTTAEDVFGTPQIIVNNAGVASTGMALTAQEADWDRVMDTNVKGVWNVSREAAQRLINAHATGSIVNISSTLGLRVSPGLSSYAISKAAVVQLTRTLALEWAAHGIRVNALCPGYFITDMNREFLTSADGQAYLKRTPGGRAGNLSELDAPLLLLASDAGAWVNGVALPVDGGHALGNL